MSKCKNQHELQFENEHVAVWKTVVAPDQSLDIHKEDFPKVVIGLKGGNLKHYDQEMSELNLETHKAYWIAGETLHGKVNTSNEPIEVMVIEMKTPKNLPLPNIPID